MLPGGPLPDPDDPQLKGLLGKRASIYRVLYEHRDGDGLTYDEMQALLPQYQGRSQFQRRVRQLRQWFIIDHLRDGVLTRHRLSRVRASFGDSGEISGRLRAKVLEPARCFRCGKTPADDGVRLVADHRIPREWGGPTEEWNLQPLCTQCNGEKQDRLSEYDEHSTLIAAAIKHDEVQRRIGELLLAFEGRPVPGDLVQIVASAGEFRNDWERRFRDLRILGWKVHVKKVYEGGKPVGAVYSVEEAQPWPEEPLSRVIRRAELQRRKDRSGG